MQKIETLETKLGQIRKQALFLGDMSELHRKEIKSKKLEVDEKERDKVFLQEQLIKARNESNRIKGQLYKSSQRYDSLYVQAQEFLKNCDDKDKIKELLQILDETNEDK